MVGGGTTLVVDVVVVPVVGGATEAGGALVASLALVVVSTAAASTAAVSPRSENPSSRTTAPTASNAVLRVSTHHTRSRVGAATVDPLTSHRRCRSTPPPSRSEHRSVAR